MRDGFFSGDVSFFYARKARNSVPRLCLLDSGTTGIFLKNMRLTFLKNIRLFNKKNHTPAHAHPNARTRLTVVESRRLGKARSPHARTRPLRARAEPNYLRGRAPVHTPPTRAGKAARKKDCFHHEHTPPNAHGQGAPEKPPLQKTIPLQKNNHTAPILPPTGNIEKRDSVRIKVLNEGGWEIGKRETR